MHEVIIRYQNNPTYPYSAPLTETYRDCGKVEVEARQQIKFLNAILTLESKERKECKNNYIFRAITH